MAVVLALCAAVGHVALWVVAFNRLHAMPLSRRTIKHVERVIFAIVAAVPTLFLWQVYANGGVMPGQNVPAAWFVYATFCWFALAAVSASFLQHRFIAPPRTRLLSNDSAMLDIVGQLGERPIDGLATKMLAAIPGNQIFQIQVNEKCVALDRLPAGLQNLTITHLSDLHFTGHITRSFFDTVIDRANELDSDLIAVTGDIIDKPELIEWIPETLGRLKSRFGIYFVLGNHDQRARDVGELRRCLTDCGLIDVAAESRTIDVGGERILLAGNELPWFGAADVPTRKTAPDDLFRILLSHSPDQLQWARDRAFDLMLAGHTHGGQIRLPLVGPLISPSYFGVRFAGGLFHEPPTLMHVSRGISAKDPIRLNCPPELTKLVLQSAIRDPLPTQPQLATATVD